MANVFIAPKIKVGFQERSDTFTGKLAYVIYYDEKGKLRKEQSWESWRDKDIPSEEYGNLPIEGFTINKDIKRYSDWGHSGRTMIRVHDPRGFEFEVTTENLIGILMHTDCLRRGLIGQFVYAWFGKELVLLPTNSVDYQEAVQYSGNLAKKVSAKVLTPGISYKTKREGDVIYLGKFLWHEYNKKHYCTFGPRLERRTHVFTKDGKSFFPKSSADFLSVPNTDAPVSNLAEIIDEFNKKSVSHKIIKYEVKPVSFNETIINNKFVRETYFVESKIPNVYCLAFVSVVQQYHARNTPIIGYKMSNNDYGYHSYSRNRTQRALRITDGALVEVPDNIQNFTDVPIRYRYGYDESNITLDSLKNHKFFDLFVIYENGEEKQIKSFYELTTETQ